MQCSVAIHNLLAVQKVACYWKTYTVLKKCNSGSSVVTFSELLHNTDTDLFTYVGDSGGVTARNHSLTEVQVETKSF